MDSNIVYDSSAAVLSLTNYSIVAVVPCRYDKLAAALVEKYIEISIGFLHRKLAYEAP
jgi:hypothetical protein